MSLADDIAQALKSVLLTTRIDIEEPRIVVPGIVTGAAYAANDVFGAVFEIPNVARTPGGSFVMTTAMFYDLDDEGIAKTLHLFRAIPAIVPADNAAMALNDVDVRLIIPGSPVLFTTFTDYANNQTSTVSPTLYGRCNPNTTSIWGLLETEGADNISAIPEIAFVVARD